ncbi:MAG: DUF4382 domain-containing protein [Gammaproteobacteria bacterium]|nr:DUF4382 domain-containing protein [Gammaproteobacteria bacterium]
MNEIRARVLLALVLTFGFLVTGCGGSSGGSASFGSAGPETGTVAIVVTDNPTDDFDAIELSVMRIELLAADGERVEIFSDPAGVTVDLLKLANFSELFALSQSVPAKLYDKIRLTLKELELVRKDQNGNDLDRIAVKLPGNGKLDLNPRTQFLVKPGGALIVQLDIDAKKSIHIVGTGSGAYQFRPVVFVKLIGGGVLGKLVRLRGVIEDPVSDGAGGGTFNLCPANPKALAERDRCVNVRVTDGTSLFNNIADPIAFEDLMKTGDSATVIGQLSRDDKALVLDAAVVEVGAPGTFTTLTGTVDAPTSITDTFGFTLDPAQGGIPAGTSIQVQLQNETKVFSKQGQELEFQSIQAGLTAAADGILLLSNTDPDTLKSTLIVLDLLKAQLVKLSGTVVEPIDSATRQFFVENDIGGQECAVAAPDARIVRITSSSSEGLTSDLAEFDALAPGQEVNVFGTSQQGACLVADTIVIFIVL